MSLCEKCGYFCGKVGGAIICYWLFLPVEAVSKDKICPAYVKREER